uniref:Protein odr-4 homolog n=1 Tax=Eptatretus burgeri TaxID=7764 RepID=A0A8C4N8R5_EPTBU
MEDLLIDEPVRHDVSLEHGLMMPRRVFVPTPCVEFCDYLFGDENFADVMSHWKELLDPPLPLCEEQLDASPETLAVLADVEQEEFSQTGSLTRSTLPPPTRSTHRRLLRNPGLLLTVLIAILAMGLSLVFLME